MSLRMLGESFLKIPQRVRTVLEDEVIRPIINFTNPMMIGAEDNGWVDPNVTDCGDI